MLILFDHRTPLGLIHALPAHTIATAYAKGWDRLKNGALLKAAVENAFDILLTTDRRIEYQQNLKDRKIAIVVLTGSTKWSRVRLHFEPIIAAVNVVTPGSSCNLKNGGIPGNITQHPDRDIGALRPYAPPLILPIRLDPAHRTLETQLRSCLL